MSLRSVAGKSITVQSAEIKSATVEIKTLTVSRKQVTLATFRQIPQERLIEGRTLTLRGVVWGRVNYFWDAVDVEATYYFESPSKYHKEHSYPRQGPAIHVLWQLGTELRRDVVYYRANIKKVAFAKLTDWAVAAFKTQPSEPRTTLIGTLLKSDWPYIYVNSGVFEEITGLKFSEVLPEPPKQLSPEWDPGEFKFSALSSQSADEQWAVHQHRERVYADYVKRQEQYDHALNAWKEKAAPRLLQIAKEHYTRSLAETNQHNALINALQQTDQLFIAV